MAASRIRTLVRAIVAVLCSIVYFNTRGFNPGNTSTQLEGTATIHASITSDEADEDNSLAVRTLQNNLFQFCFDATTDADINSLDAKVKASYALPPPPHAQQPRDPVAATKRCNRVVIDFGANIGDTAGHAVTAGLFQCKHVSNLRFDIETRTIDRGGRNAMANHLEHLMHPDPNDSDSRTYGPQDYCYYGVEGNPVFTPRLENLQDAIMSLTPRPLKYLHFFTESVGAGEVGMTKLYLDTVNTDRNFWGSSIFKSHGDVKRSAEKNNATEVAADVMGYTISELVRNTLKVYDPAHVGKGERIKGQHLILKIDIEGGEYPLLLEAAKNGTLCELVAMGNRVDAFVEFHSQKVTGPNPLASKGRAAKNELEKCGVRFNNLGANWA